MADPVFPPLFVTFLAGQISNPKLPDEFFTTGKNELMKLKLTSDASDKTWEVKLKGRRFSGGWVDFSAAHGLRNDDVLVFRHDGDMVFHVSPSGRSFSQIQCVSDNDDTDEDDDSDDDDSDSDSKNISPKKKPRIKTASSSSEDSCLIPCIAKPFGRTNGLDTRCCEIELMNQSRKSWVSSLRYNRVTGQSYIRGNWRSFCQNNKLKNGLSYRFKLVKNGTRPVLQLCSSGITSEGNCSKPHGKSNASAKSSSSNSEDDDHDAEDSENDDDYNSNDGGSEDDSDDDDSDEKFCLLAPTSSNLRQNRVRLSKLFTRANGLNKRCGEIDLMNSSGTATWTHSLRYNATTDHACIRGGWRSFCRANKLKTRSFYRFKLVNNRTRPSLQLCSDGILEGNCSKYNGKANVLAKSGSGSGSASMKQNKFLTVIYKPYMLKSRQLRLPVHFVKMNGIKEAGHITLVDKNGVKWPSYVAFTSRRGVLFYITTNWIQFCTANGLKTGETITLEFVRGEGTMHMLKFCSMAKRGQALSDGSDEEEEAQQETETPVQKRARVSAEGEPSRRTRASNNASADPRPGSISDQLKKVKQNIVDTLNDVKRLQSELEIKQQNLKASLQDIDALGERVFEINKLFK